MTAEAVGSKEQGAGSEESREKAQKIRSRYPVGLSRNAEGHWVVTHVFSSFEALEIVRVVLLGSDEAVVTEASIRHPDGRPPRSPFGPGEKIEDLHLARWLFGTDMRRAELLEPFAEWQPGEVVRFITRGEIEGAALLCRRKGEP